MWKMAPWVFFVLLDNTVYHDQTLGDKKSGKAIHDTHMDQSVLTVTATEGKEL